MRGATAQKMPVTILGHPAGAGQVRRPDCLGAFCVMRWIEMQNDPGNLPPIRAFRIGIEKAQIGGRSPGSFCISIHRMTQNVPRQSGRRTWPAPAG